MKDKEIQQLMIPVTKPERLYQCGTWSIVYPPKGYLNHNVKKGENDEITNTVTS